MTSNPTANLYDRLEEDPWRFLKLSQEELFDLDYTEVEKIQLALFQQRFRDLKPKLRALQRLAEEVGLEEISGFDDLTRLAMPHTMFKSYSALDVQKARFDKLTRWLQALTTHDLSSVHAEHCESEKFRYSRSVRSKKNCSSTRTPISSSHIMTSRVFTRRAVNMFLSVPGLPATVVTTFPSSCVS